MHSLKFKILGIVTCIIVLIVTAISYTEYRVQKQLITQISEKNARILAGTLHSSIDNAMRSGRSDEVSRILTGIKAEKSVRELRIFDETGVILNSSEREEIGTKVSEQELRTLENAMASAQHFVKDEDAFESLTPIFNRPACHGCHDASKKILGILEVELSIDYLQQYINKGKQTTLTATAAIIILVFITLSVFLIFYVDRPLKSIIAAMQQVEEGDLDVRANVGNSTEMELLSENFNLMTGKLKSLMETTINHERDLSRAQAQLAHHHEISQMNERLEEQLGEIENLNISLEERIEDIEEANYKIADLAGELEDKNTNLEKAVAKLSTLYTIGLAINSTMDTEKLFKLVVENTMATLNAQIGYIILFDKTDHVLRVSTLLGHDSSSSQEAILQMKPTSVSTWVIENHMPLLIPDISDFPQFDRYSALGYERKSLICAPLQVKNEIIGTITVVNKKDTTTFTADEMDLLTTIAAQASISIKNAMLYQEQQTIYLNTIQALVSAIEASDSYTRGHSERVTRYSVELAKKLNLPAARLNIIERAAILHDIGKIGIDLSLLHKAGKLTPDDISELRQHPTIGMKILEPIEFLSDVRLCIGQHHERYDGSGYPHKVNVEGLLLESRILAIADAFDAMTSDRPYRKALPKEVAIRELLDHAGSQFDPELVRHFVELLETGDIFSSDDSSQDSKESRKVVKMSTYDNRTSS